MVLKGLNITVLYFLFCSGQLIPVPGQHCLLHVTSPFPFCLAELSMRRSRPCLLGCPGAPGSCAARMGRGWAMAAPRAGSQQSWDRRGRAWLKAQMCHRKTSKIPCFQFLTSGRFLSCSVTLSCLVWCQWFVAEQSLCLYTHQELNLTCCTGLFMIYFSQVRMATLSDTEIIPSIKCPWGEVCPFYVTVKHNPPGFTSVDVKASHNSSSDKLFL